MSFVFEEFESQPLGQDFTVFIRPHSKVIKVTQNANFLSQILHFK